MFHRMSTISNSVIAPAPFVLTKNPRYRVFGSASANVVSPLLNEKPVTSEGGRYSPKRFAARGALVEKEPVILCPAENTGHGGMSHGVASPESKLA